LPSASIVAQFQLIGPSGIVANSTDRLLPTEPAKTRTPLLEESDLEDLEDEQDAEPVKIIDAVAMFDEFTVWGHDQIPAADDTFVKGIEEWVAFAEAIHSQPLTEERTPNQIVTLKEQTR
jgi:ribonuclease H2 subunit C